MLEPDMKLRKLQLIELEMLKEFIRICEKHQLRYFLLGGSALGAVRHAGFIPWDDDIDIGMPRHDFNKFISIAQSEFKDDLFLQTFTTDPDYPFYFAKIRNAQTTFVQSNLSHLDINHGIFIDIFALDGYPSLSIPVKIINYINSSIFTKLNIQTGDNNTSIKTKVSNLVALLMSAILPLNVLRKLLDDLIQSFEYKKCDFVINWFGAHGKKEAVPKDFYGNGSDMKFEGITVTIPSNFDGYLKSLYGDYMSLPPVDKRISLHFTDIIHLDSSYKLISNADCR